MLIRFKIDFSIYNKKEVKSMEIREIDTIPGVAQEENNSSERCDD